MSLMNWIRNRLYYLKHMILLKHYILILKKSFKELEVCVHILDLSEHSLKFELSALKSANKMLLENVKDFKLNCL